MKNKRLMISLAIGLSILFSLLYFILFEVYIPSTDQVSEKTLYMNQIGLYKDENNASKVRDTLKSKSIEAYIYKNKELYVIVSGVSESEKETEANAKLLKDNAYSYILKKVKIQDDTILQYIENKDIQKALEMIANKS